MKYIIPHDSIILCNKYNEEQFDATKVGLIIRDMNINKRDMWELEIHVTDNCNLKCKNCSYASRRNNSSLNPEKLNKTILEAINRKVHTIFISGGGEPSVWEGWNEFFKHKSEYSEVSWGIATNGLNIERNIGKHINFFSLYQIHLLGYDKTSVIREAGVDCFVKMDESLKYLLRNKSSDTQVTLKFLLNKETLCEVQNYLDYIYELSPDVIIMKLTQDYLHHENMFESKEYTSILKIIDNHKISEKFSVRHNSLNRSVFDNLSVPKKCWVTELGLYYLIRGNGDIYPCVTASYENENRLGNIYLNSLDDVILNTKERKLLTQKMKLKKCPLGACRHYRFSKLIDKYQNNQLEITAKTQSLLL